MSGVTIEVADHDVGIAAPDGAGFHVFACDPRLLRLDGSLHPGWVEAARAARALLGRPGPRTARSFLGRAGRAMSGT